MPYDDFYDYKPPRRRDDGIKAKTQRGQFGKSWWASRWIAALERLVDPGRLQRGRSYARQGQVVSLDIRPGVVTADVQGSQPRPYKVEIAITPLNDAAWNKVYDALAAQALFAAKLLAGEMPQNVEEAFAVAGVSLFPAKRGDLGTDCTCPDSSNPCKHIAAVYYLLGERFDEDPFLLFQLRGRTREQLIEALRARRSGGAEPAKATRPRPTEAEQPTELPLKNFWAGDDPAGLEALRFSIAAPPIAAMPVRQAGKPPFWPEKPPFHTFIEPAYTNVMRSALRLAFGEPAETASRKKRT